MALSLASFLSAICFLVFVLLVTVLVIIYLMSTEMPNWKTIRKTFTRDVQAAYIYFRTLSYIKKCHYQNQTVVDLFRKCAQKYPDKVCFVVGDDEWTYRELDEFSNRVGNYFLSLGFSKGDEVALFLNNCPEYVGIWLGLAKIGIVTALVNTNQKADTLAHSINVVDIKAVIFGRSFSGVVKESIEFLKNKDTMQFYCFSERSSQEEHTVSFPAKSFNAVLEETSPEPISPKKVKVSFQDKMLYIYTSGTTGLPKAAIIRHSRFLWIGVAAQFTSQLDDYETVYNPLPMYHSAGGLLFVSVVLIFGGKMILRPKFSATNYWKEAVKHKATVGQYIGEICRYLLNQPVREEETQHCMKLMFGNGLRAHIWKEFQERFNIKRIVEMYGATEGNANLVNMFGKVGAVGFLPRVCSRLYPVYLVRVNPETGEPLRNSKGLCIRCQPGEPGELVGKIISNPINSFDGYANKTDTKKKIISDCFDKGDIAFLSGDILTMDEDGYLYFKDRTGDTFRWRGENVSTGEVENVFSTALGHVSCVVYGVEIPNVEGKAGMAAVQTEQEIDFAALYQNVSKRLPLYALPLFVRVSSDIESTGTYKLRKVGIQKEGYNPDEVADPMFFLDQKQKTYVPLTKDLYSDIVNGVVKL
ncbi:hypothetical protein JTE90_020056 [Oedothorax gibbosus]|uniref:Very long-chain fatty acid transport protein n=1 Tax=Oedothorax gibbosus TaxID=931172 RepID=A0AAV6URU3_9ARAC|nr:hypothetical protein JTE90_020056 [Oedothorax gibbosus]